MLTCDLYLIWIRENTCRWEFRQNALHSECDQINATTSGGGLAQVVIRSHPSVNYICTWHILKKQIHPKRSPDSASSCSLKLTVTKLQSSLLCKGKISRPHKVASVQETLKGPLKCAHQLIIPDGILTSTKLQAVVSNRHEHFAGLAKRNFCKSSLNQHCGYQLLRQL